MQQPIKLSFSISLSLLLSLPLCPLKSGYTLIEKEENNLLPWPYSQEENEFRSGFIVTNNNYLIDKKKGKTFFLWVFFEC
jgi:hypothetical protein